MCVHCKNNNKYGARTAMSPVPSGKPMPVAGVDGRCVYIYHKKLYYIRAMCTYECVRVPCVESVRRCDAPRTDSTESKRAKSQIYLYYKFPCTALWRAIYYSVCDSVWICSECLCAFVWWHLYWRTRCVQKHPRKREGTGIILCGAAHITRMYEMYICIRIAGFSVSPHNAHEKLNAIGSLWHANWRLWCKRRITINTMNSIHNIRN